ncbi:hypothetical protein BCR37DRAFT_384122 [Protomyces lactucae-debilis]|uniref:Uncharacterized protein n=1 Tax=Protomyces lactucae-debilis TaxID=2754530 RepID=A0A1Y2EU36_PROLT|nr:uncharacterized protein BCR37DRAFT_384122 [Protomyces lactucae-debilis]ORY75069.1 hypothetical protein BCR37DRAFT_384122 [Protomyces lactucae-debilis]
MARYGFTGFMTVLVPTLGAVYYFRPQPYRPPMHESVNVRQGKTKDWNDGKQATT